ncbi:carbohydrate esterase family 5 protein [Cadophora sp. DSE1049]|nr:carbohydrate esterase family 5 protein [Cadophora sp. DSE1049]
MHKVYRLLLLSTTSLFASAAPLEIRAACHKYVIISTRGTNEPQGPSAGFVGMINQTLTSVPGGIEYDTVYPAGDDTQSEGAADIIQYINTGLVACPDQKYALLGYSQGATATAEALNYFNDTTSGGFEAISAALVIGNPTHVPNQPANFDQKGGRATYGATGVLTPFPKYTKISPAWYATTKLRDICYENDLVCVGLTLSATLNLFANHLLYGSMPSVQNQGSAFLIPLLL